MAIFYKLFVVITIIIIQWVSVPRPTFIWYIFWNKVKSCLPHRKVSGHDLVQQTVNINIEYQMKYANSTLSFLPIKWFIFKSYNKYLNSTSNSL